MELEETENWEFRRVKIKGKLLKTTHFVNRDKNGEKGYLVFRPFIISKESTGTDSYNKHMTLTPSVKGLMVNLGWISARKAFNMGFPVPDYIKNVEVDSEKKALYK